MGQGYFILTNIKALHSSPRLFFASLVKIGPVVLQIKMWNVNNNSMTMMMTDVQILIRKNSFGPSAQVSYQLKVTLFLLYENEDEQIGFFK